MKVLAVWTVKGGVGKTAATVHLAHIAATSGLRTLVWDLDPQGAASFYLRVRAVVPGGATSIVRRSVDLKPLVRTTEFDNLHLLPADYSYRHLDLELDSRKKPAKRLRLKLLPLAASYDIVFIDCPPSVSLLSESVVGAADAVLVPVIPTTLSLRTLEQVRRFATDHGRPNLEVLPFLSMVDRRKKLHRETTEECVLEEGFLTTTIPSSSAIERMGLRRAPVTATLPSHPAAAAFNSLWQEISCRAGI